MPCFVFLPEQEIFSSIIFTFCYCRLSMEQCGVVCGLNISVPLKNPVKYLNISWGTLKDSVFVIVIGSICIVKNIVQAAVVQQHIDCYSGGCGFDSYSRESIFFFPRSGNKASRSTTQD